MPHPRRRYLHLKPVFFTNRLAQGLPFIPNKYINSILYGAAARAQARNPGIKLCALDFLQNHYHGMAVPTADPQELSSFLHDLDDELAKAVVRLLGQRNVKVWSQRPHVALLGNADAVLEQLAYAYLNPVAANFVDKASQWFGVSTYRFLFNQTPEKYKWIPTSKLRKLPNKPFNKKLLKKLCRQIEQLNTPLYDFHIDPFFWKQCFEETAQLSDDEIRSEILKRVKAGEDEYRKERKLEKRSCARPEDLACQNPYKPYKPSKFGRRVYCICTDPELRSQIISEYQAFCYSCQQVWKAWNAGLFYLSYPPGAFLPPRLPVANIVPGAG